MENVFMLRELTWFEWLKIEVFALQEVSSL